jgi:GT2 family glycosyltransferase
MKLSVVVSSHLSKEKNDLFIDKIDKSIGLLKNSYEVSIYENFNEYSLTEIYNIGYSESKGEIVVFCHNDLSFDDCKNWGKKLLNHFDKTDYDIIGVAGTTDLINGKWWEIRERMCGIVNHEIDRKKWTNKYSPEFKGVKPVVCVDGLFFAVRKSDKIVQFDKTITGFHFYDIDFCVNNYINGNKIGIVTDIRITHFSGGQTNDSWEINKKKFEEKYKNHLPIRLIPDIQFEEVKKTNKKLGFVSVIILTDDSQKSFELTKNCIDSFKQKSTYDNYEIIVGLNDKESRFLNKEKYETLVNKVVCYNYYNFAKLNNDIVKNHLNIKSDIILFCNNDIELVNDALTECLFVMNEKNDVGTVGARLHFGDKSLQHAGIVVFKNKQNNIFVTHLGLKTYYTYEDKKTSFVHGNTGAFLMIRKKFFEELGMFNEEYIECFEDVELNLKSILKGKKNYLANNSVCFHYESQTRNVSEQKNENTVKDYNHRLLKFISENHSKLEKIMVNV